MIKIVAPVNISKKERENIPFDFEINLDLAISSVIGQEVGVELFLPWARNLLATTSSAHPAAPPITINITITTNITITITINIIITITIIIITTITWALSAEFSFSKSAARWQIWSSRT